MLRGLHFLALRLFSREDRVVSPARILGLRFAARLSDKHGRHLFKRGMHEPVLTRFLMEHLRFEPGDVVLDVGANVGWHACVLDQLAPDDVAIHAFEPDPINCGFLRENLATNGAERVVAVEAAAAATAGRATLHRYKPSNRGRHSLIPLHEGEKVEVETLRLDDHWRESGLGDRTLRFLKIDVEGGELGVLKGAPEVLSRAKLVMLEHSPGYLRTGGHDPDALVRVMDDAGFTPCLPELSGSRPVPVESLLGLVEQRNVLWVAAGQELRPAGA